MVKSPKEYNSFKKVKSLSSKMMFDLTGRKAHSYTMETGVEGMDDNITSRSQGSRVPSGRLDRQQIGSTLGSGDFVPKSRLSMQTKDRSSDIELMKERFAKLLLGEDMSGGGKGVSSALALSNAITNLAASVFGEQSRLEPMSVERKLIRANVC